jgi:aryl carrier-like protein
VDVGLQELAALQQRLLSLDQLLYEREATLRKAIAAWNALQPAVLPEEAVLDFDSDPYDLSVIRLAEAEALTLRLAALRKARKAELIDELHRLWKRANVKEADQKAVLASARGLDSSSFVALEDEIKRRHNALETPMLEVQGRLEAAWKQLQPPESLRKPHRWRRGEPLDEALLAKAGAEAQRLEQWLQVVRPLLAEGPQSASVVGRMLGVMQDMPAGMMTGTTEGHAPPPRPQPGGVDGGGGSEADRQRLKELEEQQRLDARRIQHLEDQLGAASSGNDSRTQELEEKLLHAQAQLDEVRERFTAFVEEDRKSDLAAKAKAEATEDQLRREMEHERLEMERRRSEQAKMQAELERTRREFEELERTKEAQVKKATANTNLMRKLETASHRFQEERLVERKKTEAEERAEQLRDTAEFEGLLADRRAMMAKVTDETDGIFKTISVPPGYADEFHEKHARDRQVNPDTCTDADIRQLKVANEKLERSVERLELRCESDGLFLALRAIMSASVWKPKKLAEQIVKGPSALKVEGAKDGEILMKQLEYFLERRMVPYRKNAMSFFLEKVGSSVKKAQAGKPILMDKFVKAFDENVTAPLPN